MNRLFFVILIFPLFSMAQDKGVYFERGLSWEQVKAKAKAENKQIFVDVFATWCGPCKKMDREVYPNELVGRTVNEKFISVRIQADTAQNDNAEIRNWYRDSHNFNEKYKITAYPTFMFLNPDGTIIYRSLGYQDTTEFVKTVNLASDPKTIGFYSRLEDFKNGKRDYENLGDLANFVQTTLSDDSLAMQIAGCYIDYMAKKQTPVTSDYILFILHVARNRNLADSLAKIYNNGYLDSLDESQFLSAKWVLFYNEFNSILTTRDRFFLACYHYPQKIDSIMIKSGYSAGWAQNFVKGAIYREIYKKLVINEKPVWSNPPWALLEDSLHLKYKLIDARYHMLSFKVSYYRKIEVDWEKWVKCEDLMMGSYPPDTTKQMDVFTKLYMPAWDAFKNCSSKKVLEKALTWSDHALKLDTIFEAAYLDAKANLLFKLGLKKQAMEFEKRAADLAPDSEFVQQNYLNMGKGKPNWN